jgi:hypothetical protein
VFSATNTAEIGFSHLPVQAGDKAMFPTTERSIDQGGDARRTAMSPVQDGRQAARIVALTTGLLFGVIFVLQAVSF